MSGPLVDIPSAFRSDYRTEPVRSVRTRTVIEVTYAAGKGVEGDPVREIVAYYDDEGTLLALRDAWKESEA